MPKIEFLLNGEKKSFDADKTVADLVNFYELDVRKIAIEKDFEVIIPEKYSKTIVNEGCQIEIVHFIGGG